MGRENAGEISFRQIYLLLLLSGAILLGLILYGYYLGERLHRFGSPLNNTLQEIKLETVTAHLRIEEANAGEAPYDEEKVWRHLDAAIQYLHTEIDEIFASKSQPPADHGMDGQIELMIQKVIEIKSESAALLKAPRGSTEAAHRARRLDRRFEAFLNHWNSLERRLLEKSHNDSAVYYYTHIVLIAFSVMLVIVVGLVLGRYERQKGRNLQLLEIEVEERFRAEKALADRERLFRTVFQSSPAAIVISRLSDGRIADVNDEFVALTGYTRDEIIGRTGADLNLWENLKNRQTLFSGMKGKTEWSGEYTFVMKDRVRRSALVSARTIEINETDHVLAVAKDITEIKQATARLQESEEKFRSLFENSHAVMLLIDPEKGDIVDANPAACSFYGYSQKKLTTMNVTEINQLDAEQAFQKMRQIGIEQNKFFEFRHKVRAGRIKEVEVYSGPIRIGGRGLLFSIVHDVTDRKTAQQKLKASHHFLNIANRRNRIQPLLEEFADAIQQWTACDALGIRILEDDDTIPYAAYRGFSKAFYEKECRLSLAIDQCICCNVVNAETADIPAHHTEFGSVLIDSTTFLMQTLTEAQKEKLRGECPKAGFESVALVPIRSGEHKRLGLIHAVSRVVNGISPVHLEMLESAALQLGTALERVGAEQALRESHADLENRVRERTRKLVEANRNLTHEIEERRRTEQELVLHQGRLRKLSAELLQAREQERREIATEIHDRMGQVLAVAKIKLVLLKSGNKAESLQSIIEEALDLISRLIADTRSLTFEISPPILYELGLKPALQWLAESISSRHNLSVSIDSDDAGADIDIGHRMFLFRAVREMLFNTVKHAHADRADVRVRSTPESVEIVVRDNGVGGEAGRFFESRGFGLFSIREQLRYYAGELKVESGADLGTTISMILPLTRMGARRGGLN